MILVKKDNKVIGIEIKYIFKQHIKTFEEFFNFINNIKDILEKENFNEIKTDKDNVVLIEIPDDKILSLLIKEEKNTEQKDKKGTQDKNEKSEDIVYAIKDDFDFDFNLKQEIKVETEKSFEDFSTMFWNS